MRKARIDSAEERVRIASAARQPIDPPSNVPLDDQDKAFFANILAEFARSEWTAHQLELAAMLARTMADLEDDQRKMREEGPISHTDKGTPVINPRKAVIQMNAGIILNFRRSLSLHARAQTRDTETIGKRRSQIMAVEEDVDASDSLLARPS